jgi:hypothetical protein
VVTHPKITENICSTEETSFHPTQLL